MQDYHFRLVHTDDSEYGEAVQFALSIYDSSLLHPVRQAFPHYLVMSRHGALVAVCGYRSAAGGLMLEQFMEETACDYVNRYCGVSPSREVVVELGAFRVKSTALTPLFSRHLKSALRDQGFEYALALSPSGAADISTWSRERAAISNESTPAFAAGGSGDPALKVGVIPLLDVSSH
ncbi:hypothetical protein NOR51B_2753 [Luminiphilus syltensis NOR5-1B]|uniref:Uncharacterized protein n=1 Tax=Luminiphilus syltensis NOR5-1B TaxID=565045 RepID=B8KVD9_9GAMM|nr:thermostable hemolysin [Luminiphilus syltensis]EED36800.1 hypothetical protein NOR51B_2753 [Luminiphilus syltensis NOR5-1B]